MVRRDISKIKESDLKSQIKDYLLVKGIFSYHIHQSLGSYAGLPDRVIHFKGKVVYLEIKLPTGKMSEGQLAFRGQCEVDGIKYRVIRSLEDLQGIIDIPQIREI